MQAKLDSRITRIPSTPTEPPSFPTPGNSLSLTIPRLRQNLFESLNFPGCRIKTSYGKVRETVKSTQNKTEKMRQSPLLRARRAKLTVRGFSFEYGVLEDSLSFADPFLCQLLAGLAHQVYSSVGGGFFLAKRNSKNILYFTRRVEVLNFHTFQ